MARTMLDEYKTSKHFWAEAVETACHATNRLYLHKLLGKTAYELLIGNKPQVGYFRVFGSKCYILDKHRRSKFAPKSHEGFLLGYGSNSHPYRVYNNFTLKVEETVDVKFDESNGSQVDVATRPQIVKSLCFSVIPGSVMLTHTVLEAFITE